MLPVASSTCLFILVQLCVVCAFHERDGAAKIAVCVCGQVARWLPEYLVDGMVRSNPGYSMSLFFNMQVPDSNSNGAHYSKGREFTVSRMVGMDANATTTFLKDLLHDSPNAEVASIRFRASQSLEHWVNVVRGPIDRFTISRMAHGTPVATNIMNMYSGHVGCSDQIDQYEQEKQQKLGRPWSFDYVILTREDIYFFLPINLSQLIPLVRPTPTAAGSCDFLYKDCLSWGGFSMRVQIMNRRTEQLMLGQRFEAFDTMRRINVTRENPEQFEKFQADLHNITACPLPVSMIPATAVRAVDNKTICFQEVEIRGCVPPAAEAAMSASLMCEHEPKMLESATKKKHQHLLHKTGKRGGKKKPLLPGLFGHGKNLAV